MSFDDLMIEKDQKRTVQQIGWCYTANRHSPDPFQFHVVGFDGPSRKVILFSHNKCFNWFC